MINIAIHGMGFYSWNGGVDFVAKIADALYSTGETTIYLALEKDNIILQVLHKIWWLFKYKFNLRKYQERKKKYYEQFSKFSNIEHAFKEKNPNFKFIYYCIPVARTKEQYDYKFNKFLKKKGIDIIFPVNGWLSECVSIPWVGYVYDFQHKYFPELFSKSEIDTRDDEFSKRLEMSKAVIVHSQDTKKDILLFYPECKCRIYVLPFIPCQIPLVAKDVSKYNLPDRYYIVSNQFWQHKNHKVVFDALELLYCNGIKDIHVVCTGEMSDYRNPQYISNLREYINNLQCRGNIHLTGFVEKSEQMKMLCDSIALIQPTLFEGSPGGLAAYEAACLGKACILSDIPVNREVVGLSNIFYFNPNSKEELAQIMNEHKNDSAVLSEKILSRVNDNKKKYLHSLFDIIKTELSY